jgi:hypothetical protein
MIATRYWPKFYAGVAIMGESALEMVAKKQHDQGKWSSARLFLGRS